MRHVKVELIKSIKLNHSVSEKLNSNHIAIAIVLKLRNYEENEGG